MGQELVDRVVEPLLGGVYAGRCEDLSFQATLAPLAAAAPRYPSLSAAAASLLPAAAPAAPAPPVPSRPRSPWRLARGGDRAQGRGPEQHGWPSGDARAAPEGQP